MCGIVGAVSTRNIVPHPCAGPATASNTVAMTPAVWQCTPPALMRRATATPQGGLQRARSTARVAELLEQVTAEHLDGATGIAHPLGHARCTGHAQRPPAFQPRHERCRQPARPCGAGAQRHHRNHEELRAALQARGYVFVSQTDTEVIAHLVDSLYQGDLFEAVQAAVAQLHGAYAIAVIHKDEPHRVVGARAGSRSSWA